MNKKILIIVFILVIVGLVCYFSFYQKESPKEEEEKGAGLANPAAVFCEEEGGILENKTFENGTRGFCLFNDGSQCGQWDFFRGDCSKGQLKIEILEQGVGRLINEGETAVVHYVGMLEDATKFDSSLDRGEPFSFILGAGYVIKGWEQGVLGMKVGEKRKLIIASELGYGEAGISGLIPSNATLIFEVQLLNVLEKPDIILVDSPIFYETIQSPLKIKGQARGYWFFEADFPVKLIDANGKELVVSFAKTSADWMTEDFVPFEAVLEFEQPETENGTLILEKDNPSGLLENADEIRISVLFENAN